MKLDEWLDSAEVVRIPGGTTFRKTLPRLKLADGTSLSIQAGRSLYCTPRSDTGPWTHVEVGHPSQPPGELWREYAEDFDDPRDTVYGYVPVQLVLFYIGAHGGIAE
jgi:hypothetical protein